MAADSCAPLAVGDPPPSHAQSVILEEDIDEDYEPTTEEIQELTLLAHCVCDPADRRFDETLHTQYSVLLCKNRRAALRAH